MLRLDTDQADVLRHALTKYLGSEDHTLLSRMSRGRRKSAEAALREKGLLDQSNELTEGGKAFLKESGYVYRIMLSANERDVANMESLNSMNTEG